WPLASQALHAMPSMVHRSSRPQGLLGGVPVGEVRSLEEGEGRQREREPPAAPGTATLFGVRDESGGRATPAILLLGEMPTKSTPAGPGLPPGGRRLREKLPEGRESSSGKLPEPLEGCWRVLGGPGWSRKTVT